MMDRFFVDCETDGLYGPFLSVAALVTDAEGNELNRFYGAIRQDLISVHSKWVRENVCPYLSHVESFFVDEDALLEAFWFFWIGWRERVECIADVPYPVETRLFSRCVERDPKRRALLGPYPLYDLCTLLRARGLEPLADRCLLANQKLAPHDAMNDVRMMADLWGGLIRG